MVRDSRMNAETSQGILAALTSGNADSRRVVIQGATVITMDPTVEDQLAGDVFVEGRVIDRVEPHVPDRDLPDDVIVVPADGCIVIPGLQDTHRHCWQTQLRRMFAAVDLEQYVEVAHARLAPQYRPEDIYVATLLAGLGAIEGGVTSMLDFAHNTRTPEYSDAAFGAHEDSGIRAVVAVAPPLSGEWDHHWPADMSRVAEYSRTSRVSSAYGVFGTSDLGGDAIALTPENVARAREIGLPTVVDATFGPSASANIERLGELGLLAPDITLIHCTALSEVAWSYIEEAGVHVALVTTSDAEIGIFDANPPIIESLRRGIRPGLSVDVECSLSGDLFAQIRATYTIQRMQAFAGAQLFGTPAEPMSPRRVLEMATIDGAVVNRLEHLSGSITPGKRADLVVISTNDASTMPMNNAVSSVTLGTDSAAVRDVFVDGEIRKWGGELVGVDLVQLQSRVVESRDYLLATSGYSPDPLS
jgi:cytosine/adenosine deaminase-related metal-dependent hydrolase